MFQKMIGKMNYTEIDAIEVIYNKHFKTVAHLLSDAEVKRLSPDERKMVMKQKQEHAI